MPADPRRTDRELDLIVYGATSFVGQLTVAHLARRVADGAELRWAIAGRNAQKLAGVASDHDLGDDVAQLVADAADRAALDELAARTRVVVSTVGPYATYGSDLVAAVADAGTDYCDLTGEPQWIARMIDAHHDRAAETGSRIVHCCGFDSIPSDLGVWFTQQQAIERFGTHCQSVSYRLIGASGTASGGTIASGMNMVEEAAADPEIAKLVGDPFALMPEGVEPGVRQDDITIARRDDAAEGWIAPFVMAAINTKIVHRSHALLGRPWGDDFRYDEAMAMGAGPLGAAKAAGVGSAMVSFMAISSLGPARRLIGRFLPEPGTGPSPEQQEKGYFTVRLYGRTADGDRITTEVTGDRDPGYGSTAKMLAETAWLLADTSPDESGAPGSTTPAAVLGAPLVDRLVDHAGLTFDVVD
ncbi:MAG: saccharopine dehydrogenase NADP-binding domain-containing protein [Actinomycetota bacterium]